MQPRAARDEIVGDRDGILIVRLTAPPVEGRANQALCRLLASRLGVARHERRARHIVLHDGAEDRRLHLLPIAPGFGHRNEIRAEEDPADIRDV